MKASGKPSEIVERLNEIAGFPSGEDVELYEVRNIYIFFCWNIRPDIP